MSLEDEFKELNIPFIDETTSESEQEWGKKTLKSLSAIFKGWAIIGKAKTEQELERTKVILGKYVKDWVEPYASRGNLIPIVLFSTHPEYVVGTRLDKGYQLCVREQEYLIITIKCDLNE